MNCSPFKALNFVQVLGRNSAPTLLVLKEEDLWLNKNNPTFPVLGAVQLTSRVDQWSLRIVTKAKDEVKL